MLNFCDFIQVYVFSTNHHLKPYYFIRPNMFKLGKLPQNNNKSVLNRLCMFVKVIFKDFR